MVALENPICWFCVRYLDPTGSPVLIYASTIALRICRFRGLSVPSFFRMPHTSFPLHVMRHAIRSRKRFQRNQFSTLHITVLICKYSVPVSANIIKTYLITFNELFVNRNRLRWCAAKQTTIASSTKKCASKSNENNKKTASRISVIFLFSLHDSLSNNQFDCQINGWKNILAINPPDKIHETLFQCKKLPNAFAFRRHTVPENKKTQREKSSGLFLHYYR